MPKNGRDENDVYIIPPNFIDRGTFFGGMFKARNAVEAIAVVLAVGLPILGIHGISLTAKIIILCLTALPLGLVALIGISGESLTSFIWIFFRYLRNRRVIGKEPVGGQEKRKNHASIFQWHSEKDKEPKPVHVEEKLKKKRLRQEDFAEEFEAVPNRKRKNFHLHNSLSVHRESNQTKGECREQEITYQNPVAEYLPIEKIQNGIIYTKDHRFLKIVEVEPINFLLRSSREQRNIIYSFVSYLKISPVKIQFKSITKQADINHHLDNVRRELAVEKDERCRALQEDYLRLVERIGSQEAVTRRFFLIFEAENLGGKWRGSAEDEAVNSLQIAARTASLYLHQCGNEVIAWENEEESMTEVVYTLLNRNGPTFPERVQEVVQRYTKDSAFLGSGSVPVAEFVAPEQIDVQNSKYLVIDGLYYSYLLITGYRPKVCAGWMSLMVNAGDGIDVDLFLSRQPKERIIQKLGQQLRINRSKMKDASDTNSDFDDLDNAVRGGYFLKDGLANNEDFYYLNILLTITASSEEELEWKIREMKKLLQSQDMSANRCIFRQEQAFLSSLPLLQLEKKLYEQSKRNALTSGAASCYPFTSYEMCDDNGILMGVNKHNNSLVIIDIFNTQEYKNANFTLLGTTGAGKTFTLQLMALRMRRKHIQVFIIAPLKGHEFRRACANIGGEFIRISPSSPNCINIMEIRRADHSVSDILDGPTLDRSELAAKIQELHIFFSLIVPDMTYEEKQLLDEAFIKTYAEKGITHNNDSLEDPERPGQYRTMPVLGDLHKVLKQNQSTERMANILNRFVNGSAKNFNQQTNVNINNQYVVFDISELTGDLLVIGFFVVVVLTLSFCKEDRTQLKAVFFDELWRLIRSNPMLAEYVLEIFKTIRGYSGSAVCATQDLNDFFALDNGKYGKGILNACKSKIILNLEDEEAQCVQSNLHLSEAELMEITHFERGNGLISTNSNNITVEFKASQLEKELITTDRKELQALVDRARRNQDTECVKIT